jgi:hypothetical protein
MAHVRKPGKTKAKKRPPKHPQKSFGTLSKGENTRKNPYSKEASKVSKRAMKRIFTHGLRKKSRKAAKAIVRGVSLLTGK